LSNRIERERLRLREEVLKAAIHLAEREGWSYVSIRRIAEAIEYSTTKIYDLFENKDHLVLELLRKGFNMLAEQLEQARQSSADAHEQILALTNAYCRFAWNNGAYYRIMYGMDGVPFGVQETWQEGLRIGEIAKESLKLLHPNDDDESLYQLVYILWGTLHGICSLFLAGRLYGDKEQAEKLAKQAVMAYVNEQRSKG
jgi:AcrR family transcriptional regulator